MQAQLEDRWRAKKDGAPASGRAPNRAPQFTMRAQNVLINVPPRSLKTTILTFATVWAWLHEPTMRIMYLSANPTVLEDSARWAQTLMLSPFMNATIQASIAHYRGRTHWTLRPDQTALKNFGTTAGGARIARGMESNITGSGADWIIVDDPHDVRDSEEQIRTTCAGYDSALHNRINDPRTSIRTAIMQRFRVDDFSGHVLEHHGKGVWMHVRRPTEFRTHTTCQCGTCVGVNRYGFADWRTVEGDPIHPRFSPEFLKGEKRRLGPYGYAGQHDQEPAPPTGGMWKTRWYEWFRLPEDPVPGVGIAWHRPHGSNDHPALVLARAKHRRLFEQTVISLDGTFGNEKEREGSAVGLGIFGRPPGTKEWCWLDDQTEPVSYLEALQRVRRMICDWYDEAPHMAVLVEPKAFGPMAVEQLRRDLAKGTWRDPDTDELHELKSRTGRRCIVRVEVVRGADVDGEGRKGVMGDKVTRFYAASPDLAAGLLRLREGQSWVPAVTGETGQFPKGARDDRVDIVTQLINHYGEASALADARAMLRP